MTSFSFEQKHAGNPLIEPTEVGSVVPPFLKREQVAQGKLNLHPETIRKSRPTFSIDIWNALLPPVLGTEMKEKEVSTLIT
jgi:hypothetical protein